MTAADSTVGTPDGAELFARYAYPPNELGYCGPDGAEALLDVAGGAARDEAARRAPGFDGAWTYLEVIAAAAGLPPLHPEVVDAYWVGNALLDRVDHATFAATVRARFGSQAGADWQCLEGAGPAGAVPSHAFHVFAVYPWVGLLHGAGGGTALAVLDRCRIRWGRVLSVHGDELVVRGQPLSWDGDRLALGAAMTGPARWAQGGRSLLPDVAVGDDVALHWDWVCDRLTPPRLAMLRMHTARQLALTNRRASAVTGA